MNLPYIRVVGINIEQEGRNRHNVEFSKVEEEEFTKMAKDSENDIYDNIVRIEPHHAHHPLLAMAFDTTHSWPWLSITKVCVPRIRCHHDLISETHPNLMMVAVPCAGQVDRAGDLRPPGHQEGPRLRALRRLPEATPRRDAYAHHPHHNHP